MPFVPVKQNRIAVEIVNQLKAAILSGRFTPGQRLPTERELTGQFAVSRVVVREAVRELEIKGLVKILQGPAGGAYVTDLSPDHLDNAFLDLFLYKRVSVAEMIQARILVEGEIARLAAVRCEVESARRLQQALAAEKDGRSSHADFVANRLRFHHLLAEICGNRLFQAIASALCRLTGEVILEVKPVKKVIHRPEEHAAILRAVAAHDADGAARAMTTHLKNMGKRLGELEGDYRKKLERAARRPQRRRGERITR